MMSTDISSILDDMEKLLGDLQTKALRGILASVRPAASIDKQCAILKVRLAIECILFNCVRRADLEVPRENTISKLLATLQDCRGPNNPSLEIQQHTRNIGNYANPVLHFSPDYQEGAQLEIALLALCRILIWYIDKIDKLSDKRGKSEPGSADRAVLTLFYHYRELAMNYLSEKSTAEKVAQKFHVDGTKSTSARGVWQLLFQQVEGTETMTELVAIVAELLGKFSMSESNE